MRSLLDDGGVWWALASAVVGGAVLWALRSVVRGAVSYVSVGAVATLIGLWVDDRLPRELLVAVLVFALAERMRSAAPWHRLVRFGVLVVGVVMLAQGLSGRVPGWVEWSLVVVALVVVPATRTVRDRPGRLVLLVLALSVVALYVCVPDTELMKPALAGFLGVALFAWLPGPTGDVVDVGAAVALLLWLSASEGFGRPGAVVGAFACAGAVLLLTPVATAGRTPRLAALAVPIVFLVFCARVAGFRESRVIATLLVVVAVVVAIVVQRMVCRFPVDRYRQS